MVLWRGQDLSFIFLVPACVPKQSLLYVENHTQQFAWQSHVILSDLVNTDPSHTNRSMVSDPCGRRLPRLTPPPIQLCLSDPIHRWPASHGSGDATVIEPHRHPVTHCWSFTTPEAFMVRVVIKGPERVNESKIKFFMRNLTYILN
jgi:hypothetical protein